MGFFNERRTIKMLACILYLFSVEIFGALSAKRSILATLPAIFFIMAFLLFFYYMFSDKLMVFLNEPKTKLSLETKGLSETEGVYVLALISGKSIKEAAFEAGVSESTVRNTISRGYKKLGVANKSGLMALAEKFDITA
jgi:DNA-binding CsgD family transcriptional regulator